MFEEAEKSVIDFIKQKTGNNNNREKIFDDCFEAIREYCKNTSVQDRLYAVIMNLMSKCCEDVKDDTLSDQQRELFKNLTTPEQHLQYYQFLNDRQRRELFTGLYPQEQQKLFARLDAQKKLIPFSFFKFFWGKCLSCACCYAYDL